VGKEAKNATRLLTARFAYGKAPVASRATIVEPRDFLFPNVKDMAGHGEG
jgi:hypothetical protein